MAEFDLDLLVIGGGGSGGFTAATTALKSGAKVGMAETDRPFAVHRRYGVSRLIWMGQPASQYGDVLLDPERASSIEIAIAFNRVLEHVAPDVADLRRVRDDALPLRHFSRPEARP